MLAWRNLWQSLASLEGKKRGTILQQSWQQDPTPCYPMCSYHHRILVIIWLYPENKFTLPTAIIPKESYIFLYFPANTKYKTLICWFLLLVVSFKSYHIFIIHCSLVMKMISNQLLPYILFLLHYIHCNVHSMNLSDFFNKRYLIKKNLLSLL